MNKAIIHRYIEQEIVLLFSNHLTNQDLSKIIEGVNHFSAEQQGLSDMSATAKVEYDDMLSRKQQNCVFVLKNSNGKLLGTMSIIPRTLLDKE